MVTSDLAAEVTGTTPPEPSLAAKFVTPETLVAVAQPPRIPLTLAVVVRMPFVASWVPVGRLNRIVPAVAARVMPLMLKTIFWDPPGVSVMVLKPPLARVVLRTSCEVLAEAFPRRIRLPPPFRVSEFAPGILLLFCVV